jgi:hypothetical protein
MHAPPHKLAIFIHRDDDFIVAWEVTATSWLSVAKVPELQSNSCVHKEHACCPKEEGRSTKHPIVSNTAFGPNPTRAFTRRVVVPSTWIGE